VKTCKNCGLSSTQVFYVCPKCKTPFDTGVKHDYGKPRMDLIPVQALEDIGRVLAFGAAKYSENNWKLVDKSRYEAALLRHYAEYMKGNAIDSESGISHLAHMACNVIFLQWFEREGK
jgi:hypothetical protein